MQQQFVVQRLAVTALPLAAAAAVGLVGFAVVAAAAVGVQLVQLWWELGQSIDDASPPQSPPPVAVPAVVTPHQWLPADDSSPAAVTSFLQ